METHTARERDLELAALRRDEGLRALLRIHLEGAAAAGEVAGAPGEAATAGGQLPALLCAYRDLDSLRHDYPLVLFDDRADSAMASLSGLVDEMLRDAAARDEADDDLRRQVYGLEADVKRALSCGRERSLSVLWLEAARRLEGPLAGGGPLERDGRLVGCGPDTARQVVEHLWRMLGEESARTERAVLDELAGRLSDVLEVDRHGSRRATSAGALRDAMADGHAAGIDFEALAGVLRQGHRHAALPASRTRRIRGLRKDIDAARTRLASVGGNGATRPRPRSRGATCSSAAQALGRAREALEQRVHLARAVRAARLEIDNRYREPHHDAYFEAFDATQLSAEERRAVAPQLVCLEAHALDEGETLALLDLLASDLPVKVLLQLRELPSSVAHVGATGTTAAWADRAASLAMALGEVFVVQGAVSNLPGLGAALVDGLRYPGPALFCVYAPTAAGDGKLPCYLRAAAAAESRMMPGFVHDPSRGAEWAARFALAGNPQPQVPWPRHELGYEDAEGHEVHEELAFSSIDFMALDPRLSAYFTIVPRERWHGGMMPIAQYLELPAEQAVSHVPYVCLVDAEDRLQRAVVKRELIGEARRCASRWRRLQELAGIGNSHAQRLLAEQQARLEAQMQRTTEAPETTVAGAPPEAAPATPDAPPDAGSEAAAPAVPEPAAPPGRDDAWIDSELCTACDDCIRRNPRAFAYNEARQAYVKDAAAASYRELVEAAEECPVCIIHPGRPLHPDEPGLADLEKRAEPFA